MIWVLGGGGVSGDVFDGEREIKVSSMGIRGRMVAENSVDVSSGGESILFYVCGSQKNRGIRGFN